MFDRLIFEIKSDIEFKVVAIGSDVYHNKYKVGIDTDGNLWSCGDGRCGKLGLGNEKGQYEFKRIELEEKFVIISCGYCHTAAVDENGGLWMCGRNNSGELGINDNLQRSLFTRIPLDISVESVCCGKNNTFIVDIEGNLLVSGLYNRNVYSSFKLISEEKFKYVSCNNHMIAIDHNCHIWGYGSNSHYELGVSDIEETSEIIKINCEAKFMTVSCGVNHTALVDLNGNIWSCGAGHRGELGLGYIIDREVLNMVTSDVEYHSVYCGPAYTYASDMDQNIWYCGVSNHQNQTKFSIISNIKSDFLFNTYPRHPKNIKSAHSIIFV